MRKYIIPIIISVLFIMLISIGLYLTTSFEDTHVEKPLVYVIVKTREETMGFWQIVNMGAEIAAMELGVEMVFTGPKSETDVEEQIQMIRDAIEKKPKAMVIAATDYKALSEVGEEIIASGITLVTIDSEIDMESEHSFIATNNVEAAKTIATELVRLINGKGKVAVMAHVYGASTAIEREAGFREVVSKYKDIELIDKTWYCNGSVPQAYEQTIDILEQHPDVTAIFGANEVSLMGISRAIKDMGLTGKIHIVGFDSNEEVVEKIEEGVIHAIMVQRPFNMGYQGIKEAIEIMNNKEPEIIDTGAVLIDMSNLYTPENQKLLFPFENK